MGTLVDGIKEIFSTSKTTATHLPVCASDGTPQGRIPVADLASVLGGIYKTIGANNDLNDCKDIGVAYSWSDSVPTNSPNGVGYAAMYNFISSGNGVGNYRIQICVERGSNKSFMRVCEGGVYSNWKEFSTDIPAFYKNYDSISALSTALKVPIQYTELTTSANFNDYIETGTLLVYTVAIEKGIQNAPTGITYGYLEIIRISTTRAIQKYWKWGDTTGKPFAIRYYESGSSKWSDWNYVL